MKDRVNLESFPNPDVSMRMRRQEDSKSIRKVAQGPKGSNGWELAELVQNSDQIQMAVEKKRWDSCW